MPYSLSAAQPRPILKQFSTFSSDSGNASPYSPPSASPGFKVHFPQHLEQLVSTHDTHSPNVYDRSPISVRPNDCALPARNCRTYRPGSPYVSSKDLSIEVEEESESDVEWTTSTPKLAWHAIEKTPTYKRVIGFNTKTRRNSDDSSSSRSPPLIPDISSTSSSEDSDHPQQDSFLQASKTSFSCSLPQNSDNSKLSFLPHPHTPLASTRPRGRSRTRDSSHRGYRERTLGDEGCLGGFWHQMYL